MCPGAGSFQRPALHPGTVTGSGAGPDRGSLGRPDAVTAPSGEGPPGLLLPHDLRALHLAATENSLHWEMLAQAAQATRDERLLELASACHPCGRFGRRAGPTR
ncbi:conserved hypothetical protein [Streptomyces sviceus ATCC 29083]|uniref:Uncharacterized protein n=1 Tax=Streptomyces sviceus (strain ATCC 29083 / DSM 924 / JCM 4929 / NBRC 13980 / NCIMB 11184 / NRRL 5439 / UC 5370) TaxID=463191 RepID=B5I450_STRX2|nr:conserved hypothetical protein [Streptomyces sviceus ATCC 29083]